MKILFFTHYTELYGANRSLINLVEGLEKFNVKSMVVVPEAGDISEILKQKEIPFVIQRFNWWCGFNSKLPKNILKKGIIILRKYISYRSRGKKRKSENKKYLEELILKINRFNPNLVYSNSSVFDFGFLFAKKVEIPHVWHFREFGKKDYNLSFFDSNYYVSQHMKKSDEVIFISNAIRNYYNKNFGLNRFHVIYNGVLDLESLKKIDVRRKNTKKKQTMPITFGIVGVLSKNKGQEEAIRAMKIVCEKYPNTKLLIAGTGIQDFLYKIVKELGLENNIEFLGYVSDPFEVFLKMDVCLMCSRDEGLGRVTLEAMASNIPVIGYMGGGTLEIVEENFTGLFYKSGFNELSKKMVYLIENREHRIAMGNNARTVFEKKYTTEIYAEKIYNILKKHIN